MDTTVRVDSNTISGHIGRLVAIVAILAAAAAGLALAASSGTVDAAASHQVAVQAKGSTGTESMALLINGSEVQRLSLIHI